MPLSARLINGGKDIDNTIPVLPPSSASATVAIGGTGTFQLNDLDSSAKVGDATPTSNIDGYVDQGLIQVCNQYEQIVCYVNVSRYNAAGNPSIDACH
jgi:hypothetical protein